MNFQRELHREREEQARSVASKQAELLDASVGSVLQSLRQVMLAVSTVRPVRDLAPACADVLQNVRREMPAYLLLAIVRPDGTVACSDGIAALSDSDLVSFVKPFLEVRTFSAGGYTNVPALGPPLVGFALPFKSSTGSRSLVVAGLGLTRLDRVLANLPLSSDGQFMITDRDGLVLARIPADDRTVGSMVGSQNHAGLVARTSGATLFRDADRTQRVVAYVPAGPDPAHLSVAVSFDVAGLVAGIDRAAMRGYLLIGLSAVLSILLALFLGHRYLRVPASILLEATRRWGSGDLTARAHMPDGIATEFATLGVAFNEMAESQQAQRTELQALNDALELRVAGRTRALLESNNRLQVEIAERELTEASLRQAQKLQAVGQLAGGMANEFNNILTVILGSVELLRLRVPEHDDLQERLLDATTNAIGRGSQLTAELLAFSRKQPLLAVSMDISEAIRSMAGLLSSALGIATRLETRLNDDLWPVMLDPNQFESSILNLALNARDAMPSGGRLMISASNSTITSASSWTELPAGDYVSLAVSDSGTGMPEPVATRAFEPFFSTKAPGKGAGLGLSQVHGMVRQAGGSVAIQSRPGNGTSITMLLPRCATSPLESSSVTDNSLPAFGKDEAILLVDDDGQVRDVTQTILTESGYTVLAAIDSLSALTLLEQPNQQIRLVIADYAMPGMTGGTLTQIIRQRWPGIAVLLATGYADLPELNGHELPFDQIIRKPFRINELQARIRLVVQRQASTLMATTEVPAS